MRDLHRMLAVPSLAASVWRRSWAGVVCLALVALAFWNLTGWPPTWFDEGSHLMVPKTLVRYGVYADSDSTGFRYFGPTLGVGPTVLLPIAAVFKVLGIGLLQARLVMALYLVLAVLAFYALARRVVKERTALAAAALFVISPGLGTLEFGRQVLGEVPGLMFLCLGLHRLISAVPDARLGRLISAGVLFGAAAVTKYQLLGVMISGLGLAWVLSRRQGAPPLRVFVIPAAAAGVVFGAWQVCFLGYLGPASFMENIQYVRQAAGGAALAFSTERALAAGRLLLEPGMLLGAIVPGLVYGTAMALGSERRSDWAILMGVVVGALVWFVVASIGWRRYAYPGVALASIPAAALLLEGLGAHHANGDAESVALRWTGRLWLAAMVTLPLPVVLPRIVVPRVQDAVLMADYLNREVPPTALVATWEPEMTFLGDHRYRVPPQRLLAVAVAQVWAGGPRTSSIYDFTAGGAPDYVLEGPFARGVGVYPRERLLSEFVPIHSHGPYALFKRKTQP